MKRALLFAAALLLSSASVFAQGKPVLVVNDITAASGVELPYDLKQMRGQLVAEFKVLLGKDFAVVGEAPSAPGGAVYALNTVVTGWRAGNAAKRLLVGMGSGRESSDIEYYVADREGKKVVERKDTVRTSFYAQTAGSTGTLAHPIAQKIADRIKDAKLR
jgi:uncharacterized protein DUF4410